MTHAVVITRSIQSAIQFGGLFGRHFGLSRLPSGHSRYRLEGVFVDFIGMGCTVGSRCFDHIFYMPDIERTEQNEKWIAESVQTRTSPTTLVHFIRPDISVTELLEYIVQASQVYDPVQTD